MSTSGTNEFGSPQSEQIISDAYERVGILPDLLTSQKIISAQRSINFILTSWINRGLNLWTVKQEMMSLNANQNSYSLPSDTSDILEATLRTSNRNLGGTAASSSGGIASNAFDNNPAKACIQTAPNGNISYSWGAATYATAMVGIQSNVTTTYALVFEYSNDGATWTQVGASGSQVFAQGVIIWFVITVPTLGTSFRVRETGGSTLNIQELYFNTTLNDTVLTRLSRTEYIDTPNKNSVGRPSSFYVDRQISPVVYIWPTPTAQYNNLFYTRIRMIEDIGQMTNCADIPQRFLEALCSGLAHCLEVKKPDMDLGRANYLKGIYEDEFKRASEEDTERVPLRIYGDFSSGWTQS